MTHSNDETVKARTTSLEVRAMALALESEPPLTPEFRAEVAKTLRELKAREAALETALRPFAVLAGEKKWPIPLELRHLERARQLLGEE